jgi:hypothetical protein
MGNYFQSLLVCEERRDEGEWVGRQNICPEDEGSGLQVFLIEGLQK